MKYLKSVEEGTENAQEIIKSNIGITLDPEHEQDNDDCEEIDLTEHPDFLFKDPNDLISGEIELKRWSIFCT